MGHLLRDSDIASIKSLYPYMRIEPLTGQQEKLVILYFRGMTPAQAAGEVGCTKTKATRFLNKPETRAIMDHLRAEELEDVKITRDTLTAMLLGSHAKAATATEEIMAVRELGKMHDLYESDKGKGGNVIIHGNVQNIKQIERMSDDDLFRLAGLGNAKENLSPEHAAGLTIEGEARILSENSESEASQ